MSLVEGATIGGMVTCFQSVCAYGYTDYLIVQRVEDVGITY